MSTLTRKSLRLALLASTLLSLAGAGDALAARSGESGKASGYYEDARGLEERNDVRGAIIQMRNAVQADPENLAYRRYLGELYLAGGDAAAAEKELTLVRQRGVGEGIELALGRALLAQNKYEQALDLVTPEAADPQEKLQRHLLRAAAALGLGRNEVAEQDLTAARALDPASSPAAYGLARVAEQRGDLAGAAKLVAEAVAKEPGFLDAWLLAAHLADRRGMLGDAFTALDRAEAVRPGEPRTGIARAQMLVKAGRLDEAERTARAVAKAAPDNPSAAYTLAVVLVARGKHAEADKVLMPLEDRLQGTPEAVLLNAMVKNETGQTAQAERGYLKYLEARPDEWRPRRALVVLYLSGGNPGAAVHQLAPRAGRLEPEGIRLLASAYLRDGQWSQAATQLRRLTAVGGPLAEDAKALLARIPDKGEPDAAARAWIRASDFAAARDGAKALAEIATLKTLDAKNPAVPDLEARVRQSMGDQAGAERGFREALALSADFQPSLDGLVKLLMAKGDGAAAEAMLRERLTREPRDGDLARLAALLIDGGKAREAAELVDKTAKPDWIQSRQAGLVAHARLRDRDALAGAARALAKTGKPEALESAALALAGAGFTDEAVAALEQAAAAKPDVVMLQLRLAETLANAGRMADAVRRLEEVDRRLPRRPELVRALAELYQRQGDAKKAEQIIATLPAGDPAAPLLRAGLMMRTGRAADAASLLQAAYAKTPRGDLAAELYRARMAAGQRDEAATVLRGWLADNPGDRAVERLLADHEMASGDTANAEARLQRLLAGNPEDAVVLNNLAWLRHKRGAGDALGLAQKAASKAPGSAQIQDTLGSILVDSGQVDAGLKHLGKAAELAPKDVDIQLNYARALKVGGQKEQARSVLRAALDSPGERRSDVERLLSELEAR